MAINQQLRERIAAIASELAEEFGDVDDSNALSWLDAVETRAVEIGDALSNELLERTTSKVRPSSEEEESVCPKCGELGRYRGKRKRELIGRRGAVTVAEPEYFCPCCRKAFFPGDQDDRCGD